MNATQPQLDVTDTTVFVSRLRKTDTLEHGQIRQVFDIVNMPGLTVICISALDGDSSEAELVPVSQEYRLADGQTFTSIDDAVLAWDSLKGELELNDLLGATLLRHYHGLIRPLWDDRTAAQKAQWLTMARQFRQLATHLGLSITKTVQQ